MVLRVASLPLGAPSIHAPHFSQRPRRERSIDKMNATYDVFKRLNDTGPGLWIETVANLEQAKRWFAGLSSKKPGTYIVFDSRLGTFIESLGSLSNLLSTPCPHSS